MNRWMGVTLATVLAVSGTARADEQEAKAVIDKAIKAMGGEEKLSKVKAYASKATGTITINGGDIPFTGETTVQGLEKYRAEFEGSANGDKFKGVTVLDGGKGWRKFGESTTELDATALANAKQTVYLQVVPILIVPLKGKGFKVDSAPDEKVGDKTAAAVLATGPDGKTFTICFDKESGLPVKLNARVTDWQGQDYTDDTTFEDYKEFDGIKKATKTQTKRDGDRFIEVSLTEFKVIDSPNEDTFAEPK